MGGLLAPPKQEGGAHHPGRQCRARRRSQGFNNLACERPAPIAREVKALKGAPDDVIAQAQVLYELEWQLWLDWHELQLLAIRDPSLLDGESWDWR